MSGIFGKSGAFEAADSSLATMGRALRHRGPDDLDVFSANGIALGCALLKTRGPDEGTQPIHNGESNLAVVLDGAIYNGDELRGELEREGHAFRQNSDAELLLALYQARGTDCVHDMRGHFAFAIWDARPSGQHKLILGRDHLGQKPLFYTQSQGDLYFASEVKALIPVLGASPQIDMESLDRYLSMRFVAGEGTMIRGISKVPPATLVTFDQAGRASTRYWKLSFANKLRLSHDEYIDGLEAKFAETVAAHMTDATETGAFLSGGLDSSLIVAMMARSRGAGVPTFSIGFAEKEFDEIPYARLVSQTFGTRQIEAQATTDLLTTLPAIITSIDEPSDPVAASFFAACRLASQHVKVALGGDGGNELFAGSDRYRGVLLAKYSALLPGGLRRPLANSLIRAIPASFGYDSFGLKLRWFERMAGEKGLGESLASAVAFFRFSPEEKRELFVDTKLDLTAAARDIADRYYESDAEDPIERMQYADFCTRLPEHLLMLVDRMGSAYSMEVRSPLVDRELVEYMASMPLRMKVRGQKARYIWYKLAERLLPESIASRKKRGFRFPLAQWFAVEMYPFVKSVFEQSALVEDGLFNRAYMLRILEEHRARRIDHNWRIWMLLNIEVWYRIYIRGTTVADTQEWIGQNDRRNEGP